MKKILLLFIAMISCLTFKLEAQNSAKNDSLVICKTVDTFFDWYIDAINQKKHVEFQPIFIANKDGMTTLNFTKYLNNLSKYGFSDSLIIKEKLSYQHCINELQKVKYSSFKTKFTDLDDFEKIQCDFSNYYRWIGGQEPIDGIRIKSVKLNNPFSATVIIEFYNYNSEEKKNIFWGNYLAILRKTKGKWKIENIPLNN